MKQKQQDKLVRRFCVRRNIKIIPRFRPERAEMLRPYGKERDSVKQEIHPCLPTRPTLCCCPFFAPPPFSLSPDGADGIRDRGRGGVPQKQKLAMKDLKGDADQTMKHAEVHGQFVVQRMRSDSGLNTVEQLPSDFMWDVVENFEKRLFNYAKASSAPTLHTVRTRTMKYVHVAHPQVPVQMANTRCCFCSRWLGDEAKRRIVGCVLLYKFARSLPSLRLTILLYFCVNFDSRRRSTRCRSSSQTSRSREGKRPGRWLGRTGSEQGLRRSAWRSLSRNSGRPSTRYVGEEGGGGVLYVQMECR